MIFPDGVCIANFAGFMPALPDDPEELCDGFV
jgi:hypothetical protein